MGDTRMGETRPDDDSGNAKPAHRIFVVDDHPVVRQGLRQLIDAEPELEVCGEADQVAKATSGIDKCRPDVVIVDLFLKKSDGLDLIKTIRARWPEMGILVLTMQDEMFYAERALRAGAMGFLNKQEAGDHVISAIRHILRGQMYVSEQASPKLLRQLLSGKAGDDQASIIARLSDRELQVFILIGKGCGTKEIAAQLGLSVKTIETYRANLRDKLGLGDARDLVKYAIRWAVNQESS